MTAEKEELLEQDTAELVNSAMDVSRELRYRWHEGLQKICQFFEETFMKLNHVVAWKDDKLYFRVAKAKTKMIIEVLYPGIEDLEKYYPFSTYSYIYDAESDELMSFNALKDGPEKAAVVLIEFSTPMEDRPIFQAMAESLGAGSCAEFMTELEKTYSQTLPHRGNWPFESRDAVPTLKAWPSRQEGPPDLELILEKGKEAHEMQKAYKPEKKK
jgi:hypothetical protein